MRAVPRAGEMIRGAQLLQRGKARMKDPDAVKRFADDGLVATASSPTEFAAFVRAEIAEWSKLVQEMKLPVVTLGSK